MTTDPVLSALSTGLIGAATEALPYLGLAVVAGLVVWAALVGLRLALGAFADTAEAVDMTEYNNRGYDEYDDDPNPYVPEDRGDTQYEDAAAWERENDGRDPLNSYDYEDLDEMSDRDRAASDRGGSGSKWA